MQYASLDNLSPFQFFIQGIRKLSVDSVLKDLPMYKKIVDPETSGQDIADMLEEDPHLPGVLLMKNSELSGVISRETFYERTGKLFGTEIFLVRPINKMMETIDHQMLILPDTMLITLATQKALSRDSKSIYQPIIVEQSNHEYRLISALMLFIAQSQQLMELHNQRLFTVNAGQKISNRDAILRFIQHVGNRPEFTKAIFVDRHAIRCDNCLRMVNFSIVDIIRTFPQLNRGVIVEEKMGSRIYRLYVRHVCQNGEIWEIPLQLDERLEYRSQRPARAVDSYI